MLLVQYLAWVLSFSSILKWFVVGLDIYFRNGDALLQDLVKILVVCLLRWIANWILRHKRRMCKSPYLILFQWPPGHRLEILWQVLLPLSSLFFDLFLTNHKLSMVLINITWHFASQGTWLVEGIIELLPMSMRHRWRDIRICLACLFDWHQPCRVERLAWNLLVLPLVAINSQRG